jgi:hypothetical protein
MEINEYYNTLQELGNCKIKENKKKNTSMNPS